MVSDPLGRGKKPMLRLGCALLCLLAACAAWMALNVIVGSVGGKKYPVWTCQGVVNASVCMDQSVSCGKGEKEVVKA